MQSSKNRYVNGRKQCLNRNPESGLVYIINIAETGLIIYFIIETRIILKTGLYINIVETGLSPFSTYY
jgi:hypothetical protein